MKTLAGMAVHGLTALVVLGCSTVIDANPGADAGGDGSDDPLVDRAPVDPCPVKEVSLPSPSPQCAPCLARAFIEGADCSDLPPGTQCENGVHPSWLCNDVWECDSNAEWRRIYTGITGPLCGSRVMVGIGCDRYQRWADTCPQPDGVACLDGTALFARGDSRVITLTAHSRFGCPCGGPESGVCNYAIQCADGRVHLSSGLPCVE